MDSRDVLAVSAFALPILLILGATVAYFTGYIDTFALAVALTLVGVIIVFLVVAVGVGTHAFFKKKDKIDYNSSMSLDDVVEVDREMEKK